MLGRLKSVIARSAATKQSPGGRGLLRCARNDTSCDSLRRTGRDHSIAPIALLVGLTLPHPVAAQAPFVSLDTDGWNLHQALPTEGGGVFVRALASAVTGGMVTVDIGGTQGNLLSASFPVAATPQATIPSISFMPLPRVAPLADVPAFKWFNGITFNGAIGADGTLGFANGYHGLLLQTTNGGRTWTDLTDPSSNAVLKADIASIAISPSLGTGGPIAVAGSLSPPAKTPDFFPPLHFATRAGSDINWHASTILMADGSAQRDHYYSEMLKVQYASSNFVVALGAIAPDIATPRYPILYSGDAGRTFQPLADLGAQTGLRDLVYDSTHHLLWAASGSNGDVLRFDLSGCLAPGAATCKPSYVSASLLPSADTQPRIYGLAVSPDGKTVVAVSQTGDAYYLTDADSRLPGSSWCKTARDCAATLSPSGEGFTGEVWTASFLTDDQVMLVGRNTRNSAASAMVFLSADRGLDWYPVPIATSDWSVVQAPLTGRYVPDSAVFAAPQGTLRVAGATISTDAPSATLTPAMILGGTGTLGGPGLTVDTRANETLILNSTLSGSGSLVKTGAGTLLLRPQPLFDPDNPDGPFPNVGNYHAGGTIVRGGTLNIATDAALGVPSANDGATFLPLYYYPAPDCAGSLCKYALTLDGGTLQAANDLTLRTRWLDPGSVPRSADRQIVLGPGGGVIDSNGYRVSVPGTISGAGDLTKVGAGTLILSGVNTYKGATTITAGTLAIAGNGSIAASSGVTLAAGATFDVSGSGGQTIRDLAGSGGTVNVGAGVLAFGTDNATIFAGAFVGTGTLIKQGGGAVTLNGNSAGFAGSTAVIGGTLAIGDATTPGAVLGGNVTIGPGATVGGHGVIGGSVANAGLVSPGGSIGVLTINGNYSQGPSGSLLIQLTPNATPGVGYDQLQVGGAANLAGALVLTIDPGSYAVGTRYDVLHAAGGVSGGFGSVTYNPALAGYLTPDVSYDPFNAYVTLAPVPAPLGRPAPLFAGAQQAADMQTAIVAAVAGIADAVLAGGCDTATRRNVAMGDGCATRRLGNRLHSETWLRGIGGIGDLSGGDGRASFSNAYGGALVGYGIGGEHLTLGAGAGYLASFVSFFDGSDASQNAGLGLVYGRYESGALRVRAMAAYGGGRVDGERVIAGTGLAAMGNRDGAFGTLDLRMAYAVRLGAYTLEPRARLAYIHVGQGGFTETGAGFLDLGYGDLTTNEADGRFTLRLARGFSLRGARVTPWLEAGMQQALSGTSRVATVSAGPFGVRVPGISPSPTAGVAEAGVRIAVGNDLDGFVRYQGLLSANQVENAFSAGITCRF